MYRITHYEVINGDIELKGDQITFWYQYKALWGNSPIPELNETPAYIINYIRDQINSKLFDEIQEGNFKFSFNDLDIHLDKIENEYHRIIEGSYSLKTFMETIKVRILYEYSMYRLLMAEEDIILNDYINQHYDFHELEITNGCFMEKLTKFVKENLSEILKDR